MSRNLVNTVNLKILRAKFGNTQEDISKLIKVSSSQYSKKEKGKAVITLEEAKVIAEHFKLSIEEIFFTNVTNFLKKSIM